MRKFIFNVVDIWGRLLKVKVHAETLEAAKAILNSHGYHNFVFISEE